MGKVDEEQSLPSTSNSEPSDPAVGRRCCGGGCGRIRKLFGLRCFFVLLLTAVLFLSALFWLLPHADQTDLDPDNKFKDHDVVAAFDVEKPLFLLQDNKHQLENEIFEEFFIPSAKVIILSLEEVGGLNTTKVVFGVDPDEYLQLSPTSLSLMRELFETLENFDELTSQLKSGLHLAPYENLYVRLWNGRGSTMSSPAIVQSSVLLAVGYSPSKDRLKQLTQTINGSRSQNLGLNDSVFGRVKQVSLSSILKPSLNSSDRSGISPTSSPAPSPLPPPSHPRHGLTPATSPSPDGPANPPGCRFLYKWPSPWHYGEQPPSAAPTPSPTISPQSISPSPELRMGPAAPDFSSAPASSPPLDDAFDRVEAPESDTVTTAVPYPVSSSDGGYKIDRLIVAWGVTLITSYALCRSIARCFLLF